MIYVLDTDILTLLGHEDSPEAPRIRRHIAELSSDHQVVTTVISDKEQIRGWMAALSRTKSPEAEVAIYDRLLQHLATFRRMTVLGYSETAASITQQLRGQRIAMGTLDRKIASIVQAHHAILVTRNASDFRKVPGLRVEDWATESS